MHPNCWKVLDYRTALTPVTRLLHVYMWWKRSKDLLKRLTWMVGILLFLLVFKGQMWSCQMCLYQEDRPQHIPAVWVVPDALEAAPERKSSIEVN